MLHRLGVRVCAIMRAICPDPLAIAIGLTLLVLGLAWWRSGGDTPSALDVASSWASKGDGVWKLLSFAMQMCLILVTGHAVADAPIARRMLRAIASMPATPRQAAGLVALVSCMLGLINWGLGLIGGSMLAMFVARSMHAKGVHVSRALLAASAFTCMLVWHGGLSGSAPLLVSTADNIRATLPAGTSLQPIPLDQTVGSTLNLVVTGGLVVISVVMAALLAPSAGAHDTSCAHVPDERDDAPAQEPSSSTGSRSWFVRALEDTPLLNFALAGVIGLWAWRYYFPAQGPSGALRLSPDELNLTMLMLALVLQGTPRRLMGSVERAASHCAGIIIQFPLYAGIMGVMATSGLIADIAGALASSAGPRTLPALHFLSAAIVNVFVPSGGGQWAVQGPIIIRSTAEVGGSTPTSVMALAYGDQLTNMLQPFWALPLLAITGTRARDIAGYTLLIMLVAGLWILGCLLVAGTLGAR